MAEWNHITNLKHGHSGRGASTQVYRAWQSMWQRCTNPKNLSFLNYGGRGIKVCERWNTFENFLADVGQPPSPKHSLDRINNHGDYGPGNCRWSTKSEQGRNKRTNRLITIQGRTLCVHAWASEMGISVRQIYARIAKGWSEQDAILRPMVIGRPRKGFSYQDVKNRLSAAR